MVMANTQVYVREVRFVLEEELTQAYIFCDAYNDVPMGVQGWHHKTFSASKPIIEIMQELGTGKESYLLWPQNAPQ